MPEFNGVDTIECYFSPEVAAAIWELRQEYRIKLHHDYAIVYETFQGKPAVRVLCHAVYDETICAAFSKRNIHILGVDIYGAQERT